jgi:hypothetical protein
MTAYVTFKCDGMMPPGSAERCRAGFSVVADCYEQSWGGDAIDASDAWNKAHQHDWSDVYLPELNVVHQFCPSCTRHRAEAAHA